MAEQKIKKNMLRPKFQSQTRQKDMDKQKKQINKEDAKQEMLEWVAKF